MPVTFTVTSGSLSESYVTMINKKGETVFTPSGPGEITVSARIGTDVVTKTITVVIPPLYTSPNAVDGEGDGSLENPYSFSDAIAAVNEGQSDKIEMLAGEYVLTGAYTISNNVDIRPYYDDIVSIKPNSAGFITVASDVDASLTRLVIKDYTSYSTPLLKLNDNSKLNIESCIISGVKTTYSAAVLANIGSDAELNIEYSSISDVSTSMYIQNSYGFMFVNSGTVTANNNWWGSNEIGGNYRSDFIYMGTPIVADTYLVIEQSQDKYVLRTEWSSVITTQLVDSNGNAIDHYVPNITVTYTTNTGNLAESSLIMSYENGYKVSNVISGVTEPATVKVTANALTLNAEFEYEVPMTEIFISVDGDDSNDGTVDSPFKTIDKAISVAKEAGATVNFLPGHYDMADTFEGSGIRFNNRNITFKSYNGPVVWDRVKIYDLFVFEANTNVEIDNITVINGIKRFVLRQAIQTYGNLTVRNCVFTNATGGGFGEYIVGSNSAHVYVYDSNFTDTYIYYDGSVDPTKKSADPTIFISGEDTYLYVSGCYFENNGGYRDFVDPDPGQGILVYNPSGGEGVFRVQRGKAVIENSVFVNNTGLAMVYDNGRMNFKNCNISDTHDHVVLQVSSGGNGGTGYDVDGCYFINNTEGAISIGNPIFIQDNEVTVLNSFFYNNTAEFGGAIRLLKSGALIKNCYFEGNTAQDGGAIYNSYASLLIENCEFVNNNATGKGGVIYTEGNDDYITIQDNKFTNSNASMGGVIYSDGITTLRNNEMSGATALNGSYIYNANRIGNTYIFIAENKTYEAYPGQELEIPATLTDDMANPITGGNIIFIINDVEYPVFSQEGTAVLRYTFDSLGTFYVDGNYSGNRRYLTGAAGSTYIISKWPTTIAVSDVSIKLHEDCSVSVVLTNAEGTPIANGNIAIDFLDNVFENVTDEDGIAKFELPTDTLISGTYEITASFASDDIHEATEMTFKVYVIGNSLILLNKIDGNMIIEGVLVDSNGNPIADADIKYNAGDEILTVKTNDEGIFSLEGIQNGAVTIEFEGNMVNDPYTLTISLANIASAVDPDRAFDIPSEGANPTYSINLPHDATGNFTVVVDGKVAGNASLVNGSASVTVSDLESGNHNVTIMYSGDDKYSAIAKNTTLFVVPVYKITENKDITMLYSAKTPYKVLITKDGKAVGAGESVTITYNGKTYNVKTDANGYATLKLPDVKPNKATYAITATYNGVTVQNKVKVNSIIKASNKKVKKSKKVTKVKVTLKKVNGKYIKGTLKIKFNKKTYKVKTNKKGVATWKVKKSMLKKLKVGKKYKYKVTYGKDTVTKKLTIKK